MEAKSTPEHRIEARTEPKKQVEKQNGSENGRPLRSRRQTGNKTETETEDETYLVPEVGITIQALSTPCDRSMPFWLLMAFAWLGSASPRSQWAGPAPSCSGYEERAPQQRRKRTRTEEQRSRRLVVRFWKALLLESEICPWCFWRNAPGIPCLESDTSGLLSSKGSKHKNASASTPASATQTQRPLGPGRRGGGGPPLLHEQYCNCRPCHVVPGKCDKLQLTSSLKGASSEPLREPTPVEHIATGSNVRQTIDAFRASHLPRCFRGTAAGSQPSLLRAWMPGIVLRCRPSLFYQYKHVRTKELRVLSAWVPGPVCHISSRAREKHMSSQASEAIWYSQAHLLRAPRSATASMAGMARVPAKQKMFR